MISSPVLPQTSSGKKRDLTIDEDWTKEPSSDPSPSSEMKKPRIAAGEETIEGDRDYPPSPASASASAGNGRSNTEDVKARINKYLEVRAHPSHDLTSYLIFKGKQEPEIR